MKNDEVVAACEKLYADLQAAGIDVLLDDRKSGAGSKFKDADLIGIPVRIALGSRGLDDGNFEVKLRSASEIQNIPLEDVEDYVKSLVFNKN